MQRFTQVARVASFEGKVKTERKENCASDKGQAGLVSYTQRQVIKKKPWALDL
jgi:hypothetical protein